MRSLVGWALVVAVLAPTPALAAPPEPTRASKERVESIKAMNEAIKHYKKNNLSGAEAGLQEAIRIDPTHAQAHASLGTLYRRQERFADARESYQRAVAADPTVAEHHYDLGMVIFRLARAPGVKQTDFEREAKEAIAAFEQASARNPALPKPHFRRAKLLDQLGDPVEADKAFRMAIGADRSFTPAYVDLGEMYIDYGFANAGLAVIETASRRNPQDSAAWEGLGRAHSHLNRPAEAVDAFRKAVELDPEAASAYFGLGMSYAELRKKDEATEALENFLKKANGQVPEHTLKAARDTLARMVDVI